MRVGVNTLFLIPGEVGGSETYLRRTLAAMKQVIPAVDLVLFTNRENDAVLRSDLEGLRGVEFVPLDFAAANRYRRIVREQIQLPRAVKRARIDVLWSPGYTAPRSCCCPQVVTVLDMQYKRYPEDMSWLARAVTDALVRAACRRVEGIIAISEFSRAELLRFTPAREDAIHVTLLGVDPAFAARPPEARIHQRAAELVGAEAPYFLCVANSYPHKNVHLAVDAFDLVADGLPHHLVLVSRPRRGERALRDSLAATRHRDRVHRLKGVSFDDLVTLYQAADVFLFPSVYEGFGLPVLEAMAAGVPVITTAQAAIPELGGTHVRYVPPHRAEPMAAEIRALLGLDEAARADRLDAARDWAKRFTWEAAARATWLALKQAAATGH